ncbi:MAG: zinc-binding dehydrogenase [Firmicutes bacterium]|nr:zinc-binding dehydrogenase [Bacillota bacterium]
MKAVIFESFGDVSTLQYREVATPEPGPGEALIKVSRVGVNRLDLMARQGEVGPLPLPHISGSEVSGVVAAIGPGVQIATGTRVAVAPYLYCGRCEYCLKGQETLCLKSDILGLRSQGGYAEYVVVPEASLVPIPEGVTDSAAAAVALSAVTAWHMLVDQVRIKPGDIVLVWAAGSGVGSAAVQIARLHGARVIATAGSDAKLDAAVNNLGADWAINYRREDVYERVRAITGKRGVDVVFEHLGRDTMATSLRCLARGGTIVTCGTLTGREAVVDLWSIFAKELKVIGSYGGTRANLQRLLQLVREARFRPVIDQELPLQDAARAHQRMANREQFGKILLVP